MRQAEPLVRVVRSGLDESVHLGHVAVCDAEGTLLAELGDPNRVVFARSSMKPLQAAVSLRRIAQGLPDDLVAVMCASHDAEPVHVRAVRRLLRTGGLAESALGCPSAWPSRTADLRRAARPRRVYHNCSGKHAGMLLACVASGLETRAYLDPAHPLQREITSAVGRATGSGRPLVGVDGCGAPVFGLPLAAMATLFARLAEPARLGPLAPTAALAVDAMAAHPYLVAGRDRTDTRVMQEVPGVLCKYGAEALQCAAIREAGIGVAIKVADGAGRAAGPALVRVLELLGAIGPGQLEHLVGVARPPVLGGGRPVGWLVADLRLRPARPPRGPRAR
jgi:L-asparaginase II